MLPAGGPTATCEPCTNGVPQAGGLLIGIGGSHVMPPLMDRTYSIIEPWTPVGHGAPTKKWVYVTCRLSPSTAIHGLSRKLVAAGNSTAILAPPNVSPPSTDLDTEMALNVKGGVVLVSVASEA